MDLRTGTDDVSWKVVPYGLSETEFSGRSETAKCKFTEPGWYDVWIDSGSGEYHGYRSVYVGGLVDRDYTWNFDGREYRYSITFDYDDVLRYFVMADADERHGSLTSTNINHDLERRFVTWKDPYIEDMARDLKRMSSGMDDLQTAKFLLSFLQTIKYQSDKVFFAVEDYWKFPVETLYDRGGDCEDSAILYAALAKAMGYDSALVMFPTHMMAAIRIDDLHGDYEYFVDGERNRYYYIESTANFENFGKLPEGIDVKDEIPVFI